MSKAIEKEVKRMKTLAVLLAVFLVCVMSGYAFGADFVSETMPFLSPANGQYWLSHPSTELRVGVTEQMPYLNVGGPKYIATAGAPELSAGVSETMPFLSIAGPEYGGTGTPFNYYGISPAWQK